MKPTGNTILITGGGSGIGRGLAEAFHKLGNKVIIAGRRQQLLDETTKANPGISSVTLNIEDPAAITAFARKLTADFPAVNVVILNAGIMRPESLLQSADTADAESIVTTNLLGPIRLTAALLPHFQKQPSAAIVTVTSGLAFVPLALTPTYCATKAAIHSWTESLRYQLQSTNIQVVELAPPYVQTELMGPGQAADPRAMPLKDFIDEVIDIIKTQPKATEILVERVKPLRFAASEGNEKYDAFFKQFNDAMNHPH
ncbi:MAG TPA: SDR family oxidoreductase [Edaphobacter sp.]|nr:SDR family oxidoreductase [Edaphobacter sp.]